MKAYIRKLWALGTLMLSGVSLVSLSGQSGNIVPAALGQKSDGMKAIDLEYAIRPVDAVRITKVTVAGRQIKTGLSAGAREDKAGTPFEVGDDWLKDMSVFITNRTDEVIVCAELKFFFPDTGDGSHERPVTAYTITAGQRPDWSLYYRNGKKMAPRPAKTDIFFEAGKTLEINVGDYIDDMRSEVEERISFAKITQVNIQRQAVYFANGMLWDVGSYYVHDYGHPGKWTRLAAEFFPGHLDTN